MGKSSLDDLFGPTTTKKPPDKTSKANKADIFDLFTSDKPKAKASLDSDPEPTAKK